ncbi:MAG: hypothetical protein ACD_5C00023G0004 [uncultured bacterium]|nr:MAG: hypothetical protein ACD_5C00023G0004 [uncultured bacterium]
MPTEKQEATISPSGKCQAVPMGKRMWNYVNERNRKEFGFAYIILKDGKLVAVP